MRTISIQLREKTMKLARYIIIGLLIVAIAAPAMAKKKGVKPADAYIKAIKIAMLADPPRNSEALAFIDTIVQFHGPYPEAFFYQGNIYAEFANREYNLQKKLGHVIDMAASYDMMYESCGNDDVKKKYRKNCKKFTGIVDSIGQLYWRENYNNGVKTIEVIDNERIPALRSAGADEREAAEAALQTTADSAKTYFAIAATVQKKDYRSREGIGLIYDRLNDFDSALVYFKRASDIAPDSLNLLQNVAYVYIQLKDWQNSITYFQKIINMIPSEASVLFNIAICYNNLEMYDSAYYYNMQCIAADSTKSNAYMDISQYFLNRQRTYSDSIKYYKQENKADAADRFIGLRDAMLDSSAFYLAYVTEMEPDNKDALEQYAVVKIVRGHNEEAVKALLKLVKMEPNNKDHWVSLGDCYIRLQKFTEAMEPYEKAVALDSTDISVMELLLDLYNTSGKTDMAKKLEAKIKDLKK